MRLVSVYSCLLSMVTIYVMREGSYDRRPFFKLWTQRFSSLFGAQSLVISNTTDGSSSGKKMNMTPPSD